MSGALSFPRGVRLHWCKVREKWFLLAPERAVGLDSVGGAILGKVDGARDEAAIIDTLAAEFNAPRDRISADVGAFLTDLRQRRLIQQ